MSIMMPVTRRNHEWNSTMPINRLESFLGRMAEDVDRALEAGGLPKVFPGVAPLAAWEDDQGLHVEVEVPGLAREDIDLTVHKGVLTIAGDRKAVEGRAYLHNSRSFGRFERAITLPETINPDSVSATLAHGVLTVTFQKTPSAQPRKVEIQLNG
jgi:HSP20 family protein